MGLIAWFVFGAVIGFIARAVVPGKQPLGFAWTTLLGIAGAIGGGILGSAIYGRRLSGFEPPGFWGCIMGALIVLVVAGIIAGPRRRTTAV